MTGRTEQENPPSAKAAQKAHERYRRRLTARHHGDERDEMVVWNAYQGALDRLAAAEAELAMIKREEVAWDAATERTLAKVAETQRAADAAEAENAVLRAVVAAVEKLINEAHDCDWHYLSSWRYFVVNLRAALGAAVTPTPEATTERTRYVLDRDGDLWQLLPSGLWRCLTCESADQHGGDLLNVCGPLTELPAAVTGHPTDEGEPDCAECGVGAQTKNCQHGCRPGHPTDELPPERDEWYPDGRVTCMLCGSQRGGIHNDYKHAATGHPTDEPPTTEWHDRALIARLPAAKYELERTADGWDVYSLDVEAGGWGRPRLTEPPAGRLVPQQEGEPQPPSGFIGPLDAGDWRCPKCGNDQFNPTLHADECPTIGTPAQHEQTERPTP